MNLIKKTLVTTAIASTVLLSLACAATETIIETIEVAPVIENATIEASDQVPTCTDNKVTVDGTVYTTIAILDFRATGKVPNELLTIGVSNISNAVQKVSCETGELTRVGYEGIAWNANRLLERSRGR